MSAGQLIVVTVALGLAGGFAIWFGEQESRPLLRYGGAASLVGAIALVLMAGPPHPPPGPASRVAAAAPPLRHPFAHAPRHPAPDATRHPLAFPLRHSPAVAVPDGVPISVAQPLGVPAAAALTPARQVQVANMVERTVRGGPWSRRKPPR